MRSLTKKLGISFEDLENSNLLTSPIFLNLNFIIFLNPYEYVHVFIFQLPPQDCENSDTDLYNSNNQDPDLLKTYKAEQCGEQWQQYSDLCQQYSEEWQQYSDNFAQ